MNYFKVPAFFSSALATPVQSTSGSNAAVTVTIASVTDCRIYLLQVLWSYSDTPTGGRLTTTGCINDEIDFDITQSGPGPTFFPPVASSRGGSLAVTLAAGGGSVVGKLNLVYVIVNDANGYVVTF